MMAKFIDNRIVIVRQSPLEYLVYAVVLVVSLGITSWLAYAGPFHPIGIALPAIKHTPPPTRASVVKIYNSLPYNATVLGEVHVENHFAKQNKAQVNQTLAYAKKLAASLGANGLLTQGVYSEPGSEPASMQKYFLQGKAIYVPSV